MVRTVLVRASDDASDAAVACCVAQRFHAHIEALHVRFDLVSETKRRARALSRLARHHRTQRAVHPRDLRCCRHFADGGKGQVWVAGHGLVTRGFANGCSAALRNTHSTTPSCRCYCRIKAIFGERRPRCHRATEGVNSSVERLTHRLVDGRRRGGHGRHPAHIRAASVRGSASKQVASSAERLTATTTSTTFSASTQRLSRRTSGLQENRGYPRRITLSNIRIEANVGSVPTQGQ